MSEDLSKKTVAALKELCKKKGLSTTGTKAVLIERLNEAGGDIEDESSSEEEKPATKKRKAAEAVPEKSKKEPPAKKAKKTGTIKVHDTCPLSGGNVYEDWGVMLNQTNVGNNNNKFYVIQVIQTGSTYHCFTAWGRVGEAGAKACKNCGSSLAAAQKEFCSKFKAKTKNDWNDVQGNFSAFVAKPNLYTLIEMDHDEEGEEEMQEALKRIKSKKAGEKTAKVRPCTLDKPTQSLIKLIFDHDIFKEQMKKFDIDIKQMPLGKLSAAQVNKGYDILVDLSAAISSKNRSQIEALTGKFYTAIPHSFGRVRPPLIADAESVQNKKDMLAVLGDIALAQELANKAEEEESASEEETEVDHPLDVHYKTLKCDVASLDQQSDEYEMIEKYLNATMGEYRKLKLIDVYTINRHPETKRFSAHDGIENRKLLWHGTNVAVLVAILSSGLRIMPHSGGRVGKGIYFASENSKSAGYVGTTGGKPNLGFMFLNEVALGKEHSITKDDSSLVKPPPGFDSIVARGWTEPDPAKDTKMTIAGKEVVVPQGKPIKTQYNASSFSQSEYLIYREDQNHIRYLLKLDFN